MAKKKPHPKKPAQSSHVGRKGPQYGGNLSKNPTLPRDTGLIAMPNEHTTVDGAGGAPGGQAAGDDELNGAVIAIAPANNVPGVEPRPESMGIAPGELDPSTGGGEPLPDPVYDPEDIEYERDAANPGTSPTEAGPRKGPAAALLLVVAGVLLLLGVLKGK